MAKCDICGKIPRVGNNVSHSHLKTKRRWDPNVQRTSLYGADGRRKQVWACTRCMRNQARVRA